MAGEAPIALPRDWGLPSYAAPSRRPNDNPSAGQKQSVDYERRFEKSALPHLAHTAAGQGVWSSPSPPGERASSNFIRIGQSMRVIRGRVSAGRFLV